MATLFAIMRARLPSAASQPRAAISRSEMAATVTGSAASRSTARMARVISPRPATSGPRGRFGRMPAMSWSGSNSRIVASRCPMSVAIRAMRALSASASPASSARRFTKPETTWSAMLR